jgi:hypothetical protein
LRPVLVLSPILAETIARAGWSTHDVKQYLFDHAHMSAWRVEAFTEKWADFRIGSLARQVHLGRLPNEFHMSDDPNRLVPIVLKPDDFIVLVSGDPLRTNAYTFGQNGYLGFPTAKKIVLRENWADRIRRRPPP